MSQHIQAESGTAYRFPLRPNRITASTFIRKMRGESQAILIEDAGGGLHVVKMRGNPQSRGSLTSELVGGLLSRALGFSVADSCLVEVSAQFLERFPDAWFHTPNGPLRPTPGLHYATKFVGANESPGRPLEVLSELSEEGIVNPDEYIGIYLFDIWANHRDRRQCLYLADDRHSAFRAVFIDNGMLFGEPTASASSFAQPAYSRKEEALNVAWREASVQAWLDRFRAIIPIALPEVLRSVPLEWCADGLTGIEHTYLRRLEKLEDLLEPFVSQNGPDPAAGNVPA